MKLTIWLHICVELIGFPCGTSGKEPAGQCRRPKGHGFNPWVGKIPAGGHGKPLQYSCLENPMDRGAWWATVLRVAKSWTQLKWLSAHACTCIGLISLRSHPSKKHVVRYRKETGSTQTQEEHKEKGRVWTGSDSLDLASRKQPFKTGLLKEDFLWWLYYCTFNTAMANSGWFRIKSLWKCSKNISGIYSYSWDWRKEVIQGEEEGRRKTSQLPRLGVAGKSSWIKIG